MDKKPITKRQLADIQAMYSKSRMAAWHSLKNTLAERGHEDDHALFAAMWRDIENTTPLRRIKSE